MVVFDVVFMAGTASSAWVVSSIGRGAYPRLRKGLRVLVPSLPGHEKRGAFSRPPLPQTGSRWTETRQRAASLLHAADKLPER